MRPLARTLVGGALCLLVPLGRGGAAPLAVPAPEGRVTDAAGMLDAERRARLERTLERADTQSGIQLFVLTLPTLSGEPLRDVSVAVARSWRIGHAGADDGVLFLVVRDDRLLRLEVGYGLEARLTDLQSARLLEEVVVPRMRAGDAGGAIEAGVDAVLGHLGATPTEASRSPGPVGAALLAILGSALLLFATARVLCAPGAGSWFVFVCFLLPCFCFYALLAPPAARGRVALLVLAVAAAAFVVLRLLVRHTRAGRRWARASRLGRLLGADREVEPRAAGGGWSEEGSRGRSGASSGSSGGGGDFGGGGASTRW